MVTRTSYRRNNSMNNIDSNTIGRRTRNTSSNGYIGGLDGLRLIALLGVIFYHLFPYSLPGGYLGVIIFFVISGYLVTASFIKEWDTTHSINTIGFYFKRIKKLYPTLITVLLLSTTYMTLFAKSMLFHIESALVTNILMVYNWLQVSNNQSYFDRFSGLSPFTHLWYLSVLMQYYLIWPFIIRLLCKLSRWQAFYFLFFAAIMSSFLMFVLYHANNINRVYYGSDTRFTPFLLGAALAFVWSKDHLASQVRTKNKIIINLIGGICLGYIILMLFKMSGNVSAPYKGQMFIFSLITTVLVAVVVHPALSWGKWMSNSFFSWIGKRSYGIYVYQFPVFIFYEQLFKHQESITWGGTTLELVIILLLAELSYRFIEIPLGKSNNYNDGSKSKRSMGPFNVINKVIVSIIFIIMLVVSANGVMHAPKHQNQATVNLKRKLAKNKLAIKAQNIKAEKLQKALDAKKKAGKSATNNAPIKLNRWQKWIARKYNLTWSQESKAQSIPVTAIGDSVMLDVADDLQQVFPASHVDAQVGRQITMLPIIISNLKQENRLSNNILVNLGTNGPITTQAIAKLEAAVGKNRNIYWVNSYSPHQSFIPACNRLLFEAEHKYHNLKVIDWHTLAAANTDWFDAYDGTHPGKTGSRNYIVLVAKKIIDNTK